MLTHLANKAEIKYLRLVELDEKPGCLRISGFMQAFTTHFSSDSDACAEKILIKLAAKTSGFSYKKMI